MVWGVGCSWDFAYFVSNDQCWFPIVVACKSYELLLNTITLLVTQTAESKHSFLKTFQMNQEIWKFSENISFWGFLLWKFSRDSLFIGYTTFLQNIIFLDRMTKFTSDSTKTGKEMITSLFIYVGRRGVMDKGVVLSSWFQGLRVRILYYLHSYLNQLSTHRFPKSANGSF